MITKGQRINDRYEIIKSIGEGGMANVYLAMDVILDRKVAIKILRGDLAGDEKFIRRFQREALSASSLSHQNIVEMYDVGEDNGNYYIVMEYVEGRTLKQLLKKRGNLTIGEAIDIMLQLTDGMAHAHDGYIIHRDLKPQNIMIQDNGQIKITDFGIAMALNSTQLTQTNSVMGSVHYLPPEQASGKGSTIKSDIYSMGILFYELLTGVLPFKGDNAVEIALKQMKEPIPSVKKQNSNIPQSVENIIIKAPAKNPKNRYNDVREMYNDLKECLKEEKKDVERIVFKYPEHEADDTKKIPIIKKEEKKAKDIDVESTSDIVKEIPKEDNSKSKVAIVILVAILLLIVVSGSLILYFTAGKKIPNVVVPDVSGMSVVDAEQVLIDAGFIVNTETEKVEDENYEFGQVVKTEPSKGRSIKKGSLITIYEVKDDDDYIVEDYTGRNYIEIQTLLKNVYKLDVSIEKKSTSEVVEDNDAIIGQSVEKGKVLKEGDKIILYIPDNYDKYPDFVSESWTVDEVRAFCDEYGILLEVKEIENTGNYKEGTVIYQSRKPNDKIIKGVKLTINVAKGIPFQETEENIDSSEEEIENTP
ncbi:MAG: Stk1 family PASTA domain-containing Ser/Thr kinase [bacterium]|nr:Stk1 family PASTA domain-containing Ser/Thr kinase [bacterium]